MVTQALGYAVFDGNMPTMKIRLFFVSFDVLLLFLKLLVAKLIPFIDFEVVGQRSRGSLAYFYVIMKKKKKMSKLIPISIVSTFNFINIFFLKYKKS